MKLSEQPQQSLDLVGESVARMQSASVRIPGLTLYLISAASNETKGFFRLLTFFKNFQIFKKAYPCQFIIFLVRK